MAVLLFVVGALGAGLVVLMVAKILVKRGALVVQVVALVVKLIAKVAVITARIARVIAMLHVEGVVQLRVKENVKELAIAVRALAQLLVMDAEALALELVDLVVLVAV